MPTPNGNGAPDDVVRLAEERAAARTAKDFAAADALREQMAEAGWSVVDTADGFTLEPDVRADAAPVAAHEVASVLNEDATADVSIQWVCEGWVGDIERAAAAFRANAGSRRLQFVVADVTGEAAETLHDDDVEVLPLEPDTGWAAARNAGMRRSRAPIVIAADPSIEPTGDVFSPIESALKDPAVGVCGPFGIVTRDLREFAEAPDAGPCDAVEGYLMAFRREIVTAVGGFDEKYRWYRTADIEWSFRVKDAGFGCSVVPLPVAKHTHRMWEAATDAQRTSWSKRNFYRFLDRFRDRWDLVLAGEPEEHDHEEDHEHHHDQPITMPEGR